MGCVLVKMLFGYPSQFSPSSLILHMSRDRDMTFQRSATTSKWSVCLSPSLGRLPPFPTHFSPVVSAVRPSPYRFFPSPQS